MAILPSVAELLREVKRLIAERRRGTAELRAVRRHAEDLLEVRERERKEVALGLQSTVQTMAALKISLSMAGDSHAAHDPHLKASLDEAIALLGTCSAEIETMSTILYPPLLDHFGLPAAMDWHVKEFSQSSGIRTVLDMPRDLGRLPGKHELALYRTMQEGLIQVRRHPGCRAASVHLYRSATEVGIEVSEAGAAKGRRVEPRNAGTAAIRERVRQLGGRLEVVSGPRGATLRATLPLPQAAARLA